MMEELLILPLIILTAKILGEITERMGLPSIVGSLLAGILLGILLIEPDMELLAIFAEIGAILILFITGYKEVHLDELRKAAKIALIPTVSQISVTFLFGFLLGIFFNFSVLESVFIGVALSPTAIGVVVFSLIKCNYLSSRPGPLMLTSSIFNDIIGVFLLTIVVSMATYDRLPSGFEMLVIVGKLLLFVAIMGFLGSKVFPKLFDYVQKMYVGEAIFAAVFTIALFSAYLAEVLEQEAIIGAFVGGLVLSGIPLARIEAVESKVNGVGYGIFIPIFFAFIGMSADLAVLGTAAIFTIGLTAVALLGKLVGGFIGTKAIGFGNYDSLIFGTGMMPRGGVELVIIAIGKDLGLIGDEVFSAVVFMVVVSIIVSPILTKMVVEAKRKGLEGKSVD